MDKLIEGWKGAIRLFFRESVKLFNRYYNGDIILKDRVYPQKSILYDYDEQMVDMFNNTLRRFNNHAKKNHWGRLFNKSN